MIEIVPNWHPVFVHFTLALLSLSMVLFVVARWINTPSLRAQITTVAQWNLWVGAVISIATAVAGWLAYNSVTHDDVSHAAMTDHRNWALVTLAIFVGLAVWSTLSRAVHNKVPFLVVGVIGLGLLMTTGWKGGEIVYRYGLGVMSLPKAKGPSHAHGSGHEHQAVVAATQDDHHGGGGGHDHVPAGPNADTMTGADDHVEHSHDDQAQQEHDAHGAHPHSYTGD